MGSVRGFMSGVWDKAAVEEHSLNVSCEPAFRAAVPRKLCAKASLVLTTLCIENVALKPHAIRANLCNGVRHRVFGLVVFPAPQDEL